MIQKSSRTLMIVMFLLVWPILACRMPLLPDRATETATPEPEPTFLPTEPPAATIAPDPTPTQTTHIRPTVETQPVGEEGVEEDLTEEAGDLPLEFDFDEDVIQPPLETWEGLPVMPGAKGGYEGEGAYTFFIEASLEEISLFYENALEEMGFSLFAAIADDPESLFDIYEKGDDMTSIAAVRPEGEDLAMVILVRSTH